ncbi:hypothetical protein [Sporolactobacillus inulinus]|uniref:Uncharacterized protein n=1 Tax=Sporolactobacillus inulinus CASD TaxID=1069536 RepID=A0A0U1QP20_9BACL|nr:hypothetical protein [Sporolactobacillus inulinus]KLI02557.1 hypothetical protein SINU_07405 [Sporolactobacillus inulinus CASD]GEB77831.1 hypothetical protein SIN01_21760 [Sporolactobacillus inulinus]
MKIALRYIGESIPKRDIEEYKILMAENGVGFFSIDYEGQIQASFDEIKGVISILLDASFVSFIQSLGTNAAWDAIKLMVKKIWISTRGKKYSKLTSSGVQEKGITVSVNVNLNTNDYFFKIDGLKNTEELDRALDKIVTNIGEQRLKNDNHRIFSANFDSELNNWIIKDFLKEVMKKSKH